MDNDIWILCDLPSNKKPTKCKWVYKLKLKFDGTIDHYKNCRIVKGYSHTWRVYYFEAFARVVKYDSIHTMLILVVKNMELLQFYVCTIF